MPQYRVVSPAQAREYATRIRLGEPVVVVPDDSCYAPPYSYQPAEHYWLGQDGPICSYHPGPGPTPAGARGLSRWGFPLVTSHVAEECYTPTAGRITHLLSILDRWAKRTKGTFA